MTRAENEQAARDRFKSMLPRITEGVQQFVDDPDVVAQRASEHFEALLPDMAYVDEPGHVMAPSVFFCTVHLATYKALRERGVDVHAFGNAIIEEMRSRPAPQPSGDEAAGTMIDAMSKDATQSQSGAKEGEFVFEMAVSEDGAFDWGINVKSCAICAQYSKHDAMDLVPYMCASDDVMSDQGAQGLRRTGTIALGAKQCDFRYKKDGDPQRLAETYTDQIRLARK